MILGCSANSVPRSDALSGRNNLSPSSRTLRPVSIFSTHGQVLSPNAILSGGSIVLQGQGSYLVFDFGKEVGGIVSVQFGSASDGTQSLSMAFSESSLYSGMSSDQSNGGSGADGSLPIAVTPYGDYVTPAAELRGGFRYLTIGLTSSGSVELTGVELKFTAAPTSQDLRAYKGSFDSNDDLLNRIWYAGAYTVQMDTIDPHQGRVWPPPGSGWLNNGVSGSGLSILVDGAKRDRTIWSSDLGISAITAYVSLGDTLSVKNDLDTLFAHQDASGGLPYAGPEVNFGAISDTYHLWTLVAVIDYDLHSGDRAWILEHWPQIQSAIQFSTAKIDGNGLLSIDLLADWGRQQPGGEEIEANALLYRVLRGASFLASVVGDSASSTLYQAKASDLRNAIQSRLWDATAGMYRDVPGSSLYPQDGNSLALWFGIPDTVSQCTEISANLRARWNSFGALTPERPGAIATFPGSIEVMAHFAAEDDETALDLVRREWGYMLSSPLGTGSTFWEGYLQDGAFDYGGSYMSLAHGWATGPTSALTQYVAGVGPDWSSPTQFHFIPHLGDLSRVSAVIPLATGTVKVTWEHDSGKFVAAVNAPSAMVGRYGIPVHSGSSSVLVDGRPVWSSCAPFADNQYGEISRERNRLYLSRVAGSHTITEEDSCVSMSH
jgi:hypothetical protein